MSGIIKETRLIMADVGANNNKYWTGTLFENGDVYCEWGRVGKSGQNKTFYGVGETYLDKKAREKEKKGYKPLKTVSNSGGIVEVQTNELHSIAKQQIKTTGDAELDALIDKLVKANVHKITSNTNITYDSNSGLFQTPLGIVTLDAIDEARNILSDIQPLIEKQKFQDNRWRDWLNEYLTLIPQDIGMRRVTPERLFGDMRMLSAQNDILDSLEVSYNTFNQKPSGEQTDEKEHEKIFDLEIGNVDKKVFKRIEEKYHKTHKDMHVCSHLQVKKVFSVRLHEMVKAFEVGSSVGNIQELWHGTSMANLLSILKSGLHKSPPKSAQVTGKMFGNGLYFAVDSTKSLNYAYGYWSGTRNDNCYMFISDVAMGKEYVPKNGFDSNVESKVKTGGFNSCWAKAGISGVRNDECIIYNDNQCNLTYLVEFDR